MSKINIVHLYAKEMNIYGDNGNVLILQKRLEWRGIKSTVTKVGVGKPLPKDTHIIVGGGGQDAGQSEIAADIKQKRDTLIQMRDNGVPMLMICGMYQMFGKYFKTNTGAIIDGIGLLNTYTIAGDKRMIGNILVQSKDFGSLVGYENHSGCTYLEEGVKPLGTTKLKQGNNGKDGNEGAVYNNVYGTYLHGPILAKSPRFADYLLQIAIELAGLNNVQFGELGDDLSMLAAKVAMDRPR